jgi:nitroimidazol reductase NimA-like FMN-containing flavoprotein (pyridoxamine 5'-phosphate oxidase superfamily)
MECLELLSSVGTGRLGLSVRALPVILPVNFGLIDDQIIVRTAPGTKLDAALANAVVAFEADDSDESEKTGWSVLVQGVATVIADAAELERARSLDLKAWAGGPKDNFVQITIHTISGRRIPPSSAPAIPVIQPVGGSSASER